MRRTAILLSVVVIALTVSAPVASADTSCPAGPSDWLLYPIVGELGDPAPAPGVDPLWDIFVAAVADEGLTVEELADMLGFADVDALYSFVVSELLSVDLNENRQLCVKPFPEPSGHPAWVHNFIDDRVRAS
jgi:hypothetical protein